MNARRVSDANDAAIERMLTPKIPRSLQHKTKRIHSVTLRRMVDEVYNEAQDQPANAIGIRAEAELRIPLSTSEYPALCQTLTSGGLWGLDVNEPNDYLNQVEQEQLDELRHVLHVLGFAQRAITAAFRDVTRKEGG